MLGRSLSPVWAIVVVSFGGRQVCREETGCTGEMEIWDWLSWFRCLAESSLVRRGAPDGKSYDCERT